MAKREMKSQNVEETKVEQEVIEEATPVVEEATIEQAEPVVKEKKEDKQGSIEIGVVTGCTSLNVRKKPDKDADVATIVKAGAELKVIDSDKHKGEWYKVITADKVQGFCMKKYIKIK